MAQGRSIRDSTIRESAALYLAAAMVLLAGAALACGIKSGERAPSRPTQVPEFHRSPVTAFEQFRIDLKKTDTGCTAEPGDVTVNLGARVRLAIQLPQEIREGVTRSLEVVGQRVQLSFRIPGLEIKDAAGAFAPEVRAFDLAMESGERKSYDFSLVNSGKFDILCDNQKVGTFTVTP